MERFHKILKSPVGTLTLIAEDEALVAVLWENERRGRVKTAPTQRSDNHPVLLKTELQLKEFFAGKRTEFDLPLRFYGTRFQESVWSALRKIPFGETRTYSQLAGMIGSPKACRAVGASNGRNP